MRKGRRNDPEEVEIQMVDHEGGLTVCAVYPTPAFSAPNECRPGKGGRMSTRNNDVQVQFTVRVPSNAGFVARTVNGSVETSLLEGNVEAYTVNGSVRMATRSHARAETVNGSIRVAMGRTNWSNPVAFRTVNGSIQLELPPSAETDVRGETVNGSVETDFPLDLTRRVGPKSFKGTIGSGGRELSLRTVNGSIRLRKGP